MSTLLVGSGVLLDSLARLGHLPFAKLRAVPLQLAAAALSAGRRRAAWAAGSVAVAVALAVAIATMVSSFRSTVEDWTQSGLRADVWVRPLAAETGVWVGRLDPEIVTIAEGLFGAGAVDPFYAETISYEGRPVSFAGVAFDVVQHFGSVPFPGRDSASVFAEALRRRGACRERTVRQPLRHPRGRSGPPPASRRIARTGGGWGFSRLLAVARAGGRRPPRFPALLPRSRTERHGALPATGSRCRCGTRADARSRCEDVS